MGGLVISALAESRDGRRILTHRLTPPPAAIALCIPDQPLATEAARRVLPQHVPLATAVHNLGRVALLVAALATGDYTHLRLGNGRPPAPAAASHCIPAARASHGRRAGGRGRRRLSQWGPGSTLLAIVPEGTGPAHTVAAAMVRACEAAGYPARPAVVRPRDQGAVVIRRTGM